MDKYELRSDEIAEVEAVRQHIADFGSPVQTSPGTTSPLYDSKGEVTPMMLFVLRSRRYAVDKRGLVWRFAPEGSPKVLDRKSTPRRNNCIEMWTGRWRACTVDGKETYRKIMRMRPIDARINGLLIKDPIIHYMEAKGYKHPFDEPHEPTEKQIREMKGIREVSRTEVLARTEKELTKAATTPEQKEAVAEVLADIKPKDRSNRAPG